MFKKDGIATVEAMLSSRYAWSIALAFLATAVLLYLMTRLILTDAG